MAKKKHEEVNECDAWWCLECDRNAEMTRAQMQKHLTEKHGLKSEGLKIKKQILVHMDGDTWFQSSYEVTVPMPDGKELKLQNEVIMRRAKADMMRYA